MLNDVSYNTVINDWGWTVAYRGGYQDFASVDDLFGSINPGDHIMFAAIQSGSETFDVLAAASAADVLTHTGQDLTHQANGAEWYFNGVSMGFAGLGDAIFQSDLDILGLGERDRLSWAACALSEPTPFFPGGPLFSCNFGHDVSLVEPVLGVDRGGRSGTNIIFDNSWDRVVLTAPANPVQVPEGFSLPLFIGAASLALWIVSKRSFV